MKYLEPLFRPPAESNSLIFQAAYGCPHNRCRFCGMYKGVKYRLRDREELLHEIRQAGMRYPDTRRVFLADGDVMCLSAERLVEILSCLNDVFPRLSRVNLYANGSSILAKSRDEICEFRRLKMNTIYLGLESGDENLLKSVAKGEEACAMVNAVNFAQDCGLRASVMVLLGLGGRSGSEKHAKKTADALNKMQPRLLAVLRYIELPGAERWVGYCPLSEYEAVCELRGLLERLDLRRSVFTANHTSNPVPLKGSLPRDRERLLAELDFMLISGRLDKLGSGRVPMWL